MKDEVVNFDLSILTNTQFCLALNINQTSRKISRFYDELISHLGITNNQFTIMALISFLPSPSIARLAHVLITEPSTMSRNIANLVKMNFVDLKEDPNDQRSKITYLTNEGLGVLIEAHKIWSKTHESLLESMGKNPIEFLSDLKQIRDIVDQHQTPNTNE